MNLLKPDEKLGRFASSLYICHNKTMTALVEYGTRCLYWVHMRTRRGSGIPPGLKIFGANSVSGQAQVAQKS